MRKISVTELDLSTVVLNYAQNSIVLILLCFLNLLRFNKDNLGAHYMAFDETEKMENQGIAGFYCFGILF